VPTTTEFNEWAPKLKLGWSTSSVGRAFKSWLLAQRCFEEGRINPAAREITQRTYLAAAAKRTPIQHLGMLALWRKERPDTR